MNKKIFTINFIVLLILSIGVALFLGFYKKDFSKIPKLRANKQTVEPQQLFLDCWKIIRKRYYDKDLNKQNWQYWKKHYLNQIKTEDDAYIAINSMIESLNDPYSKFLTAREFNEQNIDMDAKITGIGVNIIMGSGKAIVVGVIDNSPAEKSGLKIGDIILKVNSNDIKGKNIADIAQSIRGEINTFVTLELLRDEKKIVKRLQRKEIKIKSVRSKVIDKDIGYIRISSFMSSHMTDEFGEALAKLENSKGLILDLRNNPGGLLPNAVMLTNMFIDKGTIVSIHNRQGKDETIVADPNLPHLSIPTIILVNRGSASASEIFSGAMKDYNRAVLVGEKTYGKGMVQRIFTLPNNTGMNITVAKYLTPSGADINKLGIEPHYKIKNPDTIYADNDKQLDKAISILKSMI